MTAIALEACSLYRFFRTGDEETVALKGVSLSVAAGEFVAVTGPSGSGKSTLLSCLAGMDDPDGGNVTIDGVRISHRSERDRTRIRARHIGVLFQSANLIAHLTVKANLALVTSFTGSRRRPTTDLLRRLDIHERADAYPSELSGGELARAGLAVALANDPTVLLADEPTGEVDSSTEARILELLTATAERGTAVIVASHSHAVAAAASRVVRLLDGRMV
jgi:putative ABC transport system ATP-binding protein